MNMTEAEGNSGRQKSLIGEVVSDRAAKTIVVRVDRRVQHRRYQKRITRQKKVYAHDENREASVGDRVKIVESRPISKLKRWRLVEVVRKAGPQ